MDPLTWLAFIRRTWRVWALLAFALAVAGAVAYVHRHGTMTERRAQEAKIAEMIRRGEKAIAEKDRLNAIAQATAFANGQAIGERRVRDQQDQIAARDRLIADQRAGTVKLRKLWQGCLSDAKARDDAAMPSGLVPEDELRAAAAADIVRVGQDADSRVARLIEFQDVLRQQCQAIGGVP